MNFQQSENQSVAIHSSLTVIIQSGELTQGYHNKLQTVGYTDIIDKIK